MKLYYIEYNANKNYPYLGEKSEVFCHYIEEHDFGFLIEYTVSGDDSESDVMIYPTIYDNWEAYYSTYRGGRKDFEKQGHKVRVK